MDELPHLFPQGTATPEQYTYPRDVRPGEFKLPPRDDRVGHGTKLIQEISAAEQHVSVLAATKPEDKRPKGVVIDFESDEGFKLQLQSLEIRRSGIELRNSRLVGKVMHATVFVPQGKMGIFVRKFEAYAKQDTRKGQPQNKTLVESIESVHLAALESFWTDAGSLPEARDEPYWWEAWLPEATNPHDIGDLFRERAQAAGIVVSPRQIRFPERRVLMARATVNQWLAVDNLFDMLAELRLAKPLASEFLAFPPHEQAGFIDDALARIQPPTTDHAAVCHLDTGVNRGHPLLELAIDQNHVLACDPSWSAADLHGHGTEMAGLALYGCLSSMLISNEPVVLQHRLESVKILPDNGQNDPDLFGDITSQAVSRIEIAAPERGGRVFCLTVTADGRDEGYPSSWSGMIDQLCAGVGEEDATYRLIVVAAGNTPPGDRHNYPQHNQLHGVEDPAQAWNALTVGAYTEMVLIEDPGLDNWVPIAPTGQISPSSRTSVIWRNKGWPLKPDIMMEGGNQAVDPATGQADYVDDLMLLTTRVSPDGALLTTTADTSAAAALASRYAAVIAARYPSLWPETVRGLLIHSARWTAGMLHEFPASGRHNRLRCYGFGVPNLSKALWSVSNAATLVVQDSLQPFQKVGTEIKTKDMHLHHLPWPTAVLQTLGDADVRMRVTLSYFIEPSPGRRGWTRKHRYQSHGLRFEVKRPLETTEAFHKRISRAAWDEDDEEVIFGTDERNWELGPQLRCKGSIHSDTWVGSAAELAECGILAIFPVTGWWKERSHLGRWSRQARYALIVTIETPQTDVDLYTPIAAQIGIPVVSEIETNET
jgi:hypothetical protein